MLYYAPLPQIEANDRDRIIFLTCGVAILTLVIQGGTMRLLLSWLWHLHAPQVAHSHTTKCTLTNTFIIAGSLLRLITADRSQ